MKKECQCKNFPDRKFIGISSLRQRKNRDAGHITAVHITFDTMRPISCLADMKKVYFSWVSLHVGAADSGESMFNRYVGGNILKTVEITSGNSAPGSMV